jgi:predicted ATPase with chaperone activity
MAEHSPIERTVEPEHAGCRLDVFLASQFPQFSRAHLRRAIDAGEVQQASYNNASGRITGELTSGEKFTTSGPTPLPDDVQQQIVENVPDASFKSPQSSWLDTIGLFLPFVFILLIFVWLQRRAAGQMGNVMSIGRSRAKTYSADKPSTTFADIAGYEGVKQEIKEVVDFLKMPDRFKEIGARVPKGMLLVGPPGTGKSMLAQRLPGLLPALEGVEALDVASIASVSARGFNACDYGKRPFRAPHHTASAGAIIGGGSQARPGEVSLAHRGVLFLDELPEFNRSVLESLREPLESGVVAISRAALQVEYPARFQLVAAMNPCPCGYLGEPSGNCRCAPPEIARYRARISGPLLDRIDLRVAVPAVTSEELFGEGAPANLLTTAQAAERVLAAQGLQRARAGKLNVELTGSELQSFCRLDRPSRRLLAQARARLALSARGVHRVLRVARTIADLDTAGSAASSELALTHLAEALQLRLADRI